jgi:transposase
MTRKVFSKEFKLEAVKLVRDRGMTCAQVARDLGIGQNAVSRWTREVKADKAQVFPGRGVMKPDDAEIARLKRELIRTRAERDILKKTIGYFAKEPT